MSKCVHVVRHGETDWNVERRWQGHRDVTLNETGLTQARAVAAALRLRGLGAVRVVSSDLRRAYRTAEIIGGALDQPIEPDQRLREIDVGSWSGATHAEVMANDLAGQGPWERDDHALFGGAESIADVRTRARSFLDDVVAGAAQTVVAVTHGGFMRIGTAEVLGLSRVTGLRGCANAALTTWCHSADHGWQLQAYNTTDHLVGAQAVSTTTREHAA